MKRDQQQEVAVPKDAVIDLDDVADEPSSVLSDAKRKKAPRRVSTSTKKQKVSKGRNSNVASERAEDEESGLLGSEDVPEKEVEREELDKDDVECCFIESSRIPTHVAKKDYPHRYPEVRNVFCLVSINFLRRIFADCVFSCRLVLCTNIRRHNQGRRKRFLSLRITSRLKWRGRSTN